MFLSVVEPDKFKRILIQDRNLLPGNEENVVLEINSVPSRE